MSVQLHTESGVPLIPFKRNALPDPVSIVFSYIGPLFTRALASQHYNAETFAETTIERYGRMQQLDTSLRRYVDFRNDSGERNEIGGRLAHFDSQTVGLDTDVMADPEFDEWRKAVPQLVAKDLAELINHLFLSTYFERIPHLDYTENYAFSSTENPCQIVTRIDHRGFHKTVTDPQGVVTKSTYLTTDLAAAREHALAEIEDVPFTDANFRHMIVVQVPFGTLSLETVVHLIKQIDPKIVEEADIQSLMASTTQKKPADDPCPPLTVEQRASIAQALLQLGVLSLPLIAMFHEDAVKEYGVDSVLAKTLAAPKQA